MTNAELANAFERGTVWVGRVDGDGFEIALSNVTQQIIAALHRSSDKVLVQRDELETLQLIASSAIKTFSRDPHDWIQDMERVQAKAEAWLSAAEAEGHHE